MEYYSAYFGQWETEEDSLLLKHLVYHENKEHVILCSICTGKEVGEARAWNERLLKWFYEEGLGLWRKYPVRFGAIRRGLGKLLKVAEEGVAVSGILCVGGSFLLFGRGGQRIGLLNTGGVKAHCKYMTMEGNYLHSGIVRSGAGILMATEDFYEHTPTELLTECLAINSLHSREKVRRHLWELGEMAVKMGGQHTCAVLFVAC